jgi:RHS repeat-associated protein
MGITTTWEKTNLMSCFAEAHVDDASARQERFDPNEIALETNAYDGCGNPFNESEASSFGRYKWIGRHFDAETGLQYDRTTYQDSGKGSWLSEDPLGFEAGDANLYRYSTNNPTTKVDPSGLYPGDLQTWGADAKPFRGKYGMFIAPITWFTSTPASKPSGVIVQRVRVNFTFWDKNGKKIDGDNSRIPTNKDYWEAWKVPAGTTAAAAPKTIVENKLTGMGVTLPEGYDALLGADDIFAFNGFTQQGCTAGLVTYAGIAYYFPDVSFGSLEGFGFKEKGHAGHEEFAGTLPSMRTPGNEAKIKDLFKNRIAGWTPHVVEATWGFKKGTGFNIIYQAAKASSNIKEIQDWKSVWTHIRLNRMHPSDSILLPQGPVIDNPMKPGFFKDNPDAIIPDARVNELLEGASMPKL